MTSKTSNTSIRPTVVVASSSTSKESSPTSNDKVSKKSKNPITDIFQNSKSNSKNHDGKSRKRKKKQHKSKKNHDEKHEKIDDPPPLPPSDEKVPPPPPPPPPPMSSLYDELDDKITTSTPVVKTNLPLSHSPPPVMPTILRQGSRSRLLTKEQLVPSSVIHTTTNQTNDSNILSPTSTTNAEELATKKFEEQLALLDATSSKLTMNNWDHSSGGSEEDEQIERICRMNNTGSIAGPIQFKFNRTQNLPLKTSPVSNDVGNNEEETVPIMTSTKKKRLHKPNDPTHSSHSASSADEDEKKSRTTKKQKKSENETTDTVVTNEVPAISTTVPITNDESIKTEPIKNEEPVASTTNEKKSDEENGNAGDNNDGRNSRSSSASSSRRRKRSSHRRHRRRRRRSSTSSSSSTSTSSDSSRSSSNRSRRRSRRHRSRSSRSSSRSSSSSSDNRGRRSSRSSRRSSRSYSRRRSYSSQSSRSSTSSRSSKSRSRSRSHNRKTSRRSNHNHNHSQQMNNNGKGRGGGLVRRGRGARNGPRGRRAQSNENLRRSPPNKNGIKFNSTLGTGGRKLPNNKQPRVLLAATPKLPTNEEDNEQTATISTTLPVNVEIKSEPIVITAIPNQQRPTGQKKNPKGKNKQQTPAYSLKRDESEDMDHADGEPIIGPKLPPEFEKKINKEHSFTPPDMDDPENMEMLNDLKYRAEVHAAKNHGLISEMQAQQLIEERETQKQLAELPLIQMPLMQSPTISSMGSFIVAGPSPMIANYPIQMAPATAQQISTSHDTSSITFEQQQQQLQQQQQQQQQNQMSPNSAASSGGESCSTPGHTTPNGTSTVLTQDGQSMMIQTASNVNPQLMQIAQSTQQLYMPMQTAVQQPRVVAVRTPQGGLQHFIEYPTAQLLQAQQQQQQQQPQYIQHNGQLVQVIRPSVAYSSAALVQQFQLQQQQQQMFAAQLQAQQIAAMQQSGGAIFLQNSAGQLVLAQQNPQAMRVVQLPYVPK